MHGYTAFLSDRILRQIVLHVSRRRSSTFHDPRRATMVAVSALTRCGFWPQESPFARVLPFRSFRRQTAHIAAHHNSQGCHILRRSLPGGACVTTRTFAPSAAGVVYRSAGLGRQDRKSTRLNSSHSQISYAVFCLKKKKHSVAS